jgi:hypothetical protein
MDGKKQFICQEPEAPILKKPITQRAGGVAQGVGPEFKPQYCQEKKKRKIKKTSSSHL